MSAAEAAVAAGADVFVIQSTVGTVKFESSTIPEFPIAEFCKNSPIPVIVGNTVGYQATYDLMEAGAAAILVGVGPGHICTSRKVLGIGVPQITATADCAAARDDYFEQTFKPSEQIITLNAGFFSDLRSVTHVTVLGHSLSAVDKAYFLAVVEALEGRPVIWTVAVRSHDEDPHKIQCL